MDASRILPLVLLGLTVGCQTPSPQTWLDSLRLVRAQAEAAAGRREAPHLEAKFGGIVRDAQAEGRMEQIANRLTEGMCHAGLTWRCRMLASRQIDAFSLPGGLIYVTRGYYDRLANDEHLAAILAHEIAHIVCKDSGRRPCRGAEAARAASVGQMGCRPLAGSVVRSEGRCPPWSNRPGVSPCRPGPARDGPGLSSSIEIRRVREAKVNDSRSDHQRDRRTLTT